MGRVTSLTAGFMAFSCWGDQGWRGVAASEERCGRGSSLPKTGAGVNDGRPSSVPVSPGERVAGPAWAGGRRGISFP